MNRNTLAAGLAIAVLTAAVPAGAQFLAADLLYVPGVAHTDGEEGSQWRSARLTWQQHHPARGPPTLLRLR